MLISLVNVNLSRINKNKAVVLHDIIQTVNNSIK